MILLNEARLVPSSYVCVNSKGGQNQLGMTESRVNWMEGRTSK